MGKGDPWQEPVSSSTILDLGIRIRMEPECILEHMKVEAISAVAGVLRWVSVVQSELVNLQTPCASSFLSTWHKPRYT